MRKVLFSITLFITVNFAFAKEQLDFTVEGTINGSTCEVVVSNQGLIRLPTSSKSSLAKPSDRAGRTRFSITLQKCPAKSSIYFEKSQTTISAAGRLLNMAETNSDMRADNVELEILNEKGEPVNLAAISGMQNNIGPSSSNAESDKYDFFVQYFATGAATPGKVKSSVTFIVESP